MNCRALAVIALVCCAPWVCGGETVTYSNAHRGFSLEVPKEWARLEDDRNDSEALWLVAGSLEGGATISARALSTAGPVDLKWFETWATTPGDDAARLFGIGNIKETGRRDTKLGNLNARCIDYTTTLNGKLVKGTTCLALGDGRGFLINIEALAQNFEKAVPAFFAVLPSFKLFKPNSRDSSYSSKRFGISLKYPAMWTALRIGTDGISLSAPLRAEEGKFNANIFIIVKKQAGFDPVMIKESASSAYNEFKEKPGMTVQGEFKATMLGNLNAHCYTVVRNGPGGQKFQVETYVAGLETRMFSVNCAAAAADFAEARETFQSILKTFHVESMPPQLEEYSSEWNGFSVKHRDDWMVIEPTVDTVGFGMKKPMEGVQFMFEALMRISMESVDWNDDLQTRSERSKKLIEKEPGHVFKGQKPAKVGGLDAVEQEYTFMLENKIPMKVVRYEVISRHRGHELEWWAPMDKYTTYLPIFEEMLKSFKILKSPDGLVTYRSRMSGVEVRIPEVWSVYESPKEPALLLVLESETKKAGGIPDIIASITVRPEKVDAGLTLGKFAEEKLAETQRQVKGSKVDKKVDAVVDGAKAIKFTLSGTLPGEPPTIADAYAVLSNGKGWLISASTRETLRPKHLKTIEAIIESIKLPEALIEVPRLP